MSMIKVSCPSCKAALKIAEEKLTETQGRVVCHECQHIFRLVKKSKKANNNAPQPKAKAPEQKKPVFSDIGASEPDPIFSTDGFPEEPQRKPKRNKPLSTELPPLHYRIPKADARAGANFAEVNQQNPVAFNLLDYKTANQQVPQVNINPPATLDANGQDPKNNITIHTGSLVFTLMGDGQGGATTMPDNRPADTGSLSHQQAAALIAAAATNSRSEQNWMIATIVALVVFMLQLFYLVLILM